MSKILPEIFYFKNLNMSRFDRVDLPEKYHEFAKKIIEAQRTYVDGHKNFTDYFNNFVEMDARNSGERIEKLLRNIDIQEI